MGWKWSVASERHGTPIGWVIDGANRNDVAMLEPTLDAVAAAGPLADIGTLHLDRGYDSGAVRDRLRAHGIGQFEMQRRATKVPQREAAASQARAAMDRRGDQHVVVELWPAPAQH